MMISNAGMRYNTASQLPGIKKRQNIQQNQNAACAELQSISSGYNASFGKKHTQLDDIIEKYDADVLNTGTRIALQSQYSQKGREKLDNINLSKEQHDEIMDMLRFGESPEEIAEYAGISADKIWALSRRHNIERKYEDYSPYLLNTALSVYEASRQ